MLLLSGKGKNTCWKMVSKYAHLLTGVVRDDNVDDAWAFYVRYMVFEKRMSEVLMMRSVVFFVKAKSYLDVLLQIHGALELHITRANYQAKIWLQTDHVIMDLENKLNETIDLWQEGTD